MAKKNKGGGSALTVDFSEVTEGGGGANKRIKAGTYKAKIEKIKVGESQSGNTMITATWVITEGKYEGTKLTDRLTITEKSVWRIYNLLKAMGKNPKKAKSKLNPQGWVNEELAIDVGDDEYDNNSGKTILTSKVEGYVSLDDFDPDEEDEDEKPKKKAKKGDKGKAKGKGKKKSKKDDDEELEEVDLEEEL